MNYLGIDHGEKKVGISIGDDVVKIASPLLVLYRESDMKLIEEIKKLLDKHHIDEIVIGSPNHKSQTPWYHVVQKFITLMRKEIVIPIHVIDERFTTQMAETLQKELPKKQRLDDEVSAALILQTYLDQNANI